MNPAALGALIARARKLDVLPAVEGVPDELLAKHACSHTLFVGILTGGKRLGEETHDSLVALRWLCSALGWGYIERKGSWSGVDRSRNILAHEARTTDDVTEFLQVDADVGFRPGDVVRMVVSPFDVVGGAYPKGAYDWEAIAEYARSGVPAERLPLFASRLVLEGARVLEAKTLPMGTFVPARGLGTGFLLARQSVLDALVERYGERIAYTTDYLGEGREETHHVFFGCQRDPEDDTPTGRYLTEDYAFCRWWELAGGDIWVFADAYLRHTKAHTFEGHLASVLPIVQEIERRKADPLAPEVLRELDADPDDGLET